MPKKSRFISYKGWKFPPTAAGVQEKLYRKYLKIVVNRPKPKLRIKRR